MIIIHCIVNFICTLSSTIYKRSPLSGELDMLILVDGKLGVFVAPPIPFQQLLPAVK